MNYSLIILILLSITTTTTIVNADYEYGFCKLKPVSEYLTNTFIGHVRIHKDADDYQVTFEFNIFGIGLNDSSYGVKIMRYGSPANDLGEVYNPDNIAINGYGYGNCPSTTSNETDYRVGDINDIVLSNGQYHDSAIYTLPQLSGDSSIIGRSMAFFTEPFCSNSNSNSNPSILSTCIIGIGNGDLQSNDLIPITPTATPTGSINTLEPSTAEPSTAEPSTAEPSTAEPSTAEPSTAEPSTAEPSPSPSPSPKSISELYNGTNIASASQTEIAKGQVTLEATTNINASVSGFTVFNSAERDRINGVEIFGIFMNLDSSTPHGIHIHTFGDLSRNDGSSIGEHWANSSQVHSLPTSNNRHYGDLGNICAFDSNFQLAYYYYFTNYFGSINNIFGRSLAVHNSQDFGAPENQGGKRILQGVIAMVNPFIQFNNIIPDRSRFHYDNICTNGTYNGFNFI